MLLDSGVFRFGLMVLFELILIFVVLRVLVMVLIVVIFWVLLLMVIVIFLVVCIEKDSLVCEIFSECDIDMRLLGFDWFSWVKILVMFLVVV